MEFDERADPAEQFGVGADPRGVVPGAFHRVGQPHPVGVAQLVRGVPVEHAGGEPGADAGDAEPGALLVAEVDDRQRTGELGAARAEFVEGGEGGDHAERAVVGAAVGDGVQVRAGDDGVPGLRVTEPGPLVAVAVGLEGQAAGPGLVLEPGPALGVGGVPGVPAVAAGGGGAAHGEQLRPHRIEALGHSSPIGL